MARNAKDESAIGHIALRQELLNNAQLRHCEAVRRERAAGGGATSLGEVMVELGYLTAGQLTSLRAEETRRTRAIPGYEVGERLGAGRVGTVYRARQISMDRAVALKVLHPALSRRPEAVREFIDEARAVARLNHPHIVQGIDVGEANGFSFFAMEFLAGGTLADRLARSGPLPEAEALLLLRQSLAALAHAGAEGLLHRDLKPANLMLDEAGRLKITDFGLAGAEMPAEIGPSGRRTVRGTAHYLAPEQIEAPQSVDARADLYSLGATFYHLLCGRPPFGGEDDKTIALARLKADPAPLAGLRAELSGECTGFLMRLLAREPGRRPASAEAALAELDRIAADPKAVGRPIRTDLRRSRKKARSDAEKRPLPVFWLALGGLLLVLLLILAGVAMMRVFG